MKKIFNLENFVYLTILAMPAYLIRVTVFGLPTNVFEILALIAIAWFVIERRSFKFAFPGGKTYLIPIVMVLGGLTLSTLAGDSYRTGLGIIKSWFIIPALFALVAAGTLRREKGKSIFAAVYISAFAVAGIALGYFFLGKTTYDGRLEAFYNSPNFLAMFLASAIVIGSGLFAERKKYYAFSLAVIIGALYLTFSYAAWLAVFVALGFRMLFKKTGWKKWGGAAFLGLVIASVLFFQTGTGKFESLIRLEERSSLASRMMIWRAAGKMVSDNVFLGIGPGNFQKEYLEYQRYFPPYLEWAVPQPHNLLLAFWLQAGLLGLLGFLALMVMWFKELLSKQKRDPSQKTIIAAAIMVYFLAHGVFDTPYFKNDLAVLFWLVFFVGIKNAPKPVRSVK